MTETARCEACDTEHPVVALLRRRAIACPATPWTQWVLLPETEERLNELEAEVFWRAYRRGWL